MRKSAFTVIAMLVALLTGAPSFASQAVVTNYRLVDGNGYTFDLVEATVNDRLANLTQAPESYTFDVENDSYTVHINLRVQKGNTKASPSFYCNPTQNGKPGTKYEFAPKSDYHFTIIRNPNVGDDAPLDEQFGCLTDAPNS